jgi:transposase
LARLLGSMDVACQVIAPSMIPKAPGDKVKTDTRDCRRLARLHRAGELVAIRVPDSGRGSGAGSVPHPRRHGRGLDPGPPSPVEVLVAPLQDLSGRVGLDA